MPSALRLTLPIPPSLNGSYRNLSDSEKGALIRLGRRAPPRVATSKLTQWKRDAGWMLQTQPRHQFAGPFRIAIYVHESTRSDVDNLGKACLDLLVKHRVTPDDRFAKSVSIERTEHVAPGECLIIVESA